MCHIKVNTKEYSSRKLTLLDDTLRQDFTILKPKIAVLGLNPQVNCGQNGDEEVNVIIPAIERAREEGIMAIGPFSAERFFSERMYEKFDAVLAMYYDQGGCGILSQWMKKVPLVILPGYL